MGGSSAKNWRVGIVGVGICFERWGKPPYNYNYGIVAAQMEGVVHV